MLLKIADAVPLGAIERTHPSELAFFFFKYIWRILHAHFRPHPSSGFEFYLRVFNSITDMLYSVYYINNNIKIFRTFPNTFRRFLKIFRILSEVHANISAHFPKISEDVRRLSRITVGCRIFPSNVRSTYDATDIMFSQ